MASKYLFKFQVLDPRLKLQYMEDHEWGKRLVNGAKNEVFLLLISLKLDTFIKYLI
jgi:hypothetical protein